MEISNQDLAYGSEKPDGYISRIVDRRVQRMLSLFGAVEIRGTRWCGKSWTAYAFGQSVLHVDDGSVRILLEADPSLALEGARPHVIDEWQEVPAIWDEARRAIDATGDAQGEFILTGSSTPEKDKVSHSGAGRIARVDMSTMTLWEMGKSTGAVSLAGLFDGEFENSLVEEPGLAPISDAICCGGWPALLGSPVEDVADAVEQYLEATFEVSVPMKGGVPETARRVAMSLARNVATSATLKTIAEDSMGDSGSHPVEATVSSYIELLENLYLLDELAGWDAPVRAKSRLRTKPKRYFADPSIPAAMLGMSPQRLLSDGQTFGLLFESLCVHDLKVYAQALPNAGADPLRYYADADGLEVDVVIELRDGRWAGIEIKLGEDKVPDGISNLKRLRNKVSSNPAARNPEPEFMAVLTGTSPLCRYDSENDVYVFPITALRP